VVRAAVKPTIAAIRGYCFGGGALLAIECDIRLAGADARFKFHGASYGRAPGGAVLPRIVGEARAKELLFTGDEVSADEALRIGLVNHVVPPGEVLEASVAMGQRIAANSPQAVKALKETIDLALPVDEALEHEHAANRDIGGSADSATRFRAAAARVIGTR
jgi:enoyl-CoA hydratase/carnithine racemase